MVVQAVHPASTPFNSKILRLIFLITSSNAGIGSFLNKLYF